MDPEATDDQRLLMETSARFIDEVCPLRAVRDNAFGDPAFADSYLRQAAELGWFSLLVPEKLAGGSVSGNGVLDAALVGYQRGRALQPGPFAAGNVVALTLAAAGNEDQQARVLPDIMSGEAPATWVVASPSGPPLRAEQTPAGFALSGVAPLVQEPGRSSWWLVTAESGQGWVQLLVKPGMANVSVTQRESLDLTRRFDEVRFDNAEVPETALVGRPEDSSPLLDRQIAVACVLTAAESVGAMEQDFELALQYAKDRIAFGRPIGSFQSVKHLLADTSLLLEMSKAVTLGAARSVGADDGYGLEAASMAKAFVGDCSVDLAQNCFQVFGGIGYTWEHDQHLYLRRLTTDATLFGSPVWHRERLCRLAGL